MQFTSTRNRQLSVSAAQAILQGISADGGLFVPQEFPQIDLKAALDMDYCSLAAYIIGEFLTDYDTDFLKQAVKEVYQSAFGSKAGYVEQVNPHTFALELWHGPTCAFKDYALQMMPRLLVQARKMQGCTDRILILVATSGDTGKAAMEGYKNLEGVQVEVFYPTGGTSEIQRLQMATQQGNNVAVYAVKGNFDDAQTGVKRVFADSSVAKALQQKKVVLSSANSINWGRLVPQIVYYFYAYGQLLRNNAIQWGDKVDFCVPTGNFGDILAGWYAKQMGLPVGKLICASNKNNVLTEFFKTGRYNAKREFFKTTSPSMDILVSSNLERLLYHMSGNDDRQVQSLMEQLAQTGSYTVSSELLQRLQEDFSADYADDQAAAEEILQRWKQDNYLCDPHTAVGFCAAKTQHTQNAMVVLSTASPYKFPAAVLQALGQTVPKNDFDALRLLAMETDTVPPQALACLEGQTERFKKIILPQEIGNAALGELAAE